MKNIVATLIMAVFILSACAPSEGAVQTAMAQTQAAAPTATNTPVSLETIRQQIEPALVLPNDFPENWQPSSFSISLPASLTSYAIPTPALIVSQGIDNIAYSESGSVTVLLFADQTQSAQAFEIILPAGEKISVGESGKRMAEEYWREVTFLRCRAVVHIRIYGFLLEQVPEYAARLDGRLTHILCQ